MSRFLFVVPPFTGHVGPALGIDEELRSRGHRTAWVCDPAAAPSLLPAGARVFPCESLPATDDFLALSGMANLEYLWEEVIVPLGHRMVPGVERACREFQPDVMVADQQAIAGAMVARSHGIPWVTSATTPIELSAVMAGIPKVEAWVRDKIDSFQACYGIDEPVDLRFSPELILAFAIAELVGGTFPEHYAFVGTSTAGRGDVHFPWNWLDPGRRHVLVSLGTLNGPAGGRFFQVVANVASEMPDIQFVCVAPEGALTETPPNLLALPRVPQVRLLASMDAVVCHAGPNTVFETLTQGLPMVVAPIRHDQPWMAEQIVSSGAGVRIRFARVRPAELREALAVVLDEPECAAAARRLQKIFQAAGGPSAAVDRLEELLVARVGGRP